MPLIMEESTRLRMVEEKIGLLLKTFECPICLELMQNPVSTKCDHKFCRHCIQETIGRQASAPCPICKKSFTKRSLSTLTEWKRIVGTVGELVRAFEEDTGTPFSPPHGASIPLSQTTTSTNYDFIGNHGEDDNPVTEDVTESLFDLPSNKEEDKENLDRKVKRRSSKRPKETDTDKNAGGEIPQQKEHNEKAVGSIEKERESSSDRKRRRVTSQGKSMFSTDPGGGDNMHSRSPSNRLQEVQGIVDGIGLTRKTCVLTDGRGDEVTCVYDRLKESQDSLEREKLQRNMETMRHTNRSNVRIANKRSTSPKRNRFEEQLNGKECENRKEIVVDLTGKRLDNKEDFGCLQLAEENYGMSEIRRTRNGKARNVRMAPKKKVDMQEFASETQSSENVNSKKSASQLANQPEQSGDGNSKQTEIKTMKNKRRPRSCDEVIRRYPTRHCKSPESLSHSPDIFQGELLIKTYGPEKVNIKKSKNANEEGNLKCVNDSKRRTRSQSASGVKDSQESMHLFTQSEEIEDRKKKRISAKLKKEEMVQDKVKKSVDKTVLVKYEGTRDKGSKIAKIHEKMGSGKGYVPDFDHIERDVTGPSLKKTLRSSKKVCDSNAFVALKKLQHTGEILVERGKDKTHGKSGKAVSDNIEITNFEPCKEIQKRNKRSSNAGKKDDAIIVEGNLNSEHLQNSRKTRSKTRFQEKSDKARDNGDTRVKKAEVKAGIKTKQYDSKRRKSRDEVTVIPDTNVHETFMCEMDLCKLKGGKMNVQVTDKDQAVSVYEREEHVTRSVSGKGGLDAEKEMLSENKLKTYGERPENMHVESVGIRRTEALDLEEISQEDGTKKVDRWLEVQPDSVSPLLSPEVMNAKLHLHEELKRVNSLEKASQECLVGDSVPSQDQGHYECIKAQGQRSVQELSLRHNDGFQLQRQRNDSEEKNLVNDRVAVYERDSSINNDGEQRQGQGQSNYKKGQEQISVSEWRHSQGQNDDLKGQAQSSNSGQNCMEGGRVVVYEKEISTGDDCVQKQSEAEKNGVKGHGRESTSDPKLGPSQNLKNEAKVQNQRNGGRHASKLSGKLENVNQGNGSSDEIENMIPPSIQMGKHKESAIKKINSEALHKKSTKNTEIHQYIMNDVSENKDARISRKIFKSRDLNLLASCEIPTKAQLPVAFVHSSPECRDPYAFKMSQRTPAKKVSKSKKSVRNKKNNKPALEMLNDYNDSVRNENERVDTVTDRKCENQNEEGLSKKPCSSPVEVDLTVIEPSQRKSVQRSSNRGCREVIELTTEIVSSLETSEIAEVEGVGKSRKGHLSRSQNKNQVTLKKNSENQDFSGDIGEEAGSVTSSQLFEDIESTCSQDSRPKKRKPRKKTVTFEKASASSETTKFQSLEDQKWLEHFKEIEEEEFIFSSSDERTQENSEKIQKLKGDSNDLEVSAESDVNRNDLEVSGEGHGDSGDVDIEALQRAIDQVRREQNIQCGNENLKGQGQVDNDDVHEEEVEREINHVRNEEGINRKKFMHEYDKSNEYSEHMTVGEIQSAKIFTEAGPLSVQLIQRGSCIEVVGASQAELCQTGEGDRCDTTADRVIEEKKSKGRIGTQVPVDESQVELFHSVDRGALEEVVNREELTQSMKGTVEDSKQKILRENEKEEVDQKDLAKDMGQFEDNIYKDNAFNGLNGTNLSETNQDEDIEEVSEADGNRKSRDKKEVAGACVNALKVRGREKVEKCGVKQDMKKEWASQRRMKREIGPRRARKLRLKSEKKTLDKKLKKSAQKYTDKHMVENESGESDTDSLEIVEDELSFEEPDLDIQPEEIKRRLSQSDDINTARDSTGVRCDPKSVNLFKSGVTTNTVNTVMETPLIPQSKTPAFQSVVQLRETKSKDGENLRIETGSIDTQEVMFMTTEERHLKKCESNSANTESYVMNNDQGAQSHDQNTLRQKLSKKYRGHSSKPETYEKHKEASNSELMASVNSSASTLSESCVDKTNTQITVSGRCQEKEVISEINTSGLPVQVCTSNLVETTASTLAETSVSNMQRDEPRNEYQNNGTGNIEPTPKGSRQADENIPGENDKITLSEGSDAQTSVKVTPRKRRSEELYIERHKSPTSETSIQTNKVKRKRLKRKTFSLSNETESPGKSGVGLRAQSLELDEVISQMADSVLSKNEAKGQSVKEVINHVTDCVMSHKKTKVQSGKDAETPGNVGVGINVNTCKSGGIQGNHLLGECHGNKEVKDSGEDDNICRASNQQNGKVDNIKANKNKVFTSVSEDMFSGQCTVSTEDACLTTQESVSMLQPVVCLQHIDINQSSGVVNCSGKSKLGPEGKSTFAHDTKTQICGEEYVDNGCENLDKLSTPESVSILQPIVCLEKIDILEVNRGIPQTHNGSVLMNTEPEDSFVPRKSSQVQMHGDCQGNGDNNDPETDGEGDNVMTTGSMLNVERTTSNQDLYSSDEEDVLIHRPSDESSQNSSQKSVITKCLEEVGDDAAEAYDELIDKGNDIEICEGRDFEVEGISSEQPDGFDCQEAVPETAQGDVILLTGENTRVNSIPLEHFEMGSGDKEHRDKVKMDRQNGPHKNSGKSKITCETIGLDDSNDGNYSNIKGRHSKNIPLFQKNNLIESDEESETEQIDSESANEPEYANEFLDFGDNTGTEVDMFETEPSDQVELLTNINEPTAYMDCDNGRINIIDETSVKDSGNKSLNIVDLTSDKFKQTTAGQCKRVNKRKESFDRFSKNGDDIKIMSKTRSYIDSYSTNRKSVRRKHDCDGVIDDETVSSDKVVTEDVDIAEIHTSSHDNNEKPKSGVSQSVTTPKDNSYFRSSRVREALLKEQTTTSPSIGSFPSAKKLRLKVDTSPVVMSAPVIQTHTPQSQNERNDASCRKSKSRNISGHLSAGVGASNLNTSEDSDSEDLPDIDFGNKSVSCESDLVADHPTFKDSTIAKSSSGAPVLEETGISSQSNVHTEKIAQNESNALAVDVEECGVRSVSDESVRSPNKLIYSAEKDNSFTSTTVESKTAAIALYESKNMTNRKISATEQYEPVICSENYLIVENTEINELSSGEVVIRETPFPDKDVLLEEELPLDSDFRIDVDRLQLNKQKWPAVETLSPLPPMSPQPKIQPQETPIPFSQDVELREERKTSTPSTVCSVSDMESDTETGNSSGCKDMNLTSSSAVSSDINQSQAKEHIEADIGELQEQIRALEALKEKYVEEKSDREVVTQNAVESETMETFDPNLDIPVDEETTDFNPGDIEINSSKEKEQVEMEHSGYESEEDMFGSSQPAEMEAVSQGKVKGQSHHGLPREQSTQNSVARETVTSPRSPTPPSEHVEDECENGIKMNDKRETLSKKALRHIHRNIRGKGLSTRENSENDFTNEVSKVSPGQDQGKGHQKRQHGDNNLLHDNNKELPGKMPSLVQTRQAGKVKRRSREDSIDKNAGKTLENVKEKIRQKGGSRMSRKVSIECLMHDSVGEPSVCDNMDELSDNTLSNISKKTQTKCDKKERAETSAHKNTDELVDFGKTKKRKLRNASKKSEKGRQETCIKATITGEGSGGDLIMSGVQPLEYSENCTDSKDHINDVDMVPESGEAVCDGKDNLKHDINMPDESCDMFNTEESVIGMKNSGSLDSEKDLYNKKRGQLNKKLKKQNNGAMEHSGESVTVNCKDQHDQNSHSNSAINTIEETMVKSESAKTVTSKIVLKNCSEKNENICHIQESSHGTSQGPVSTPGDNKLKTCNLNSAKSSYRGSLESRQGATDGMLTTSGNCSSAADCSTNRIQRAALGDSFAGGSMEKSRNKSSVTDKQSNNSVSPKTSAGFPQKPHWKFTASGISKVMDKPYIQKLCDLLGCQFVNRFNSAVTHVLVKTVDDHPLVCPRTLKYFQGIAGKVWVLSVQWAIQSVKQKKLLSEVDFEIQGDSVYRDRLHKAPARSRTSTQLLLKNYEICCHGDFELLSTGDLKGLAEMCGASTAQDPKLFTLCRDNTQVVVVDQKFAHDMLELPKIRRVYNIPIVKKEWLLDSVGEYQVKDLADYILT